MPRSASSAPVTLLVTRHIQPERYGDFLAWMRQGEILAAGFPGFLGSGVLQPPAGGDQYQIVLRFDGEASLDRWERSLPRRMWLERGAALVRGSEVRRARGMDGWFGQGPSAPPRWKQAVSIWLAYFPLLLMFSALLGERLAALPTFWRALLTSVALTPVMVYACIPLATRLLRRWLRPA
ncbi:antibiotic biosynthesis monooxygenase [Achromobacter sp. Marseille-Q0513]|uniref:antibiotic biosynthesis monooxygenase n=1 Tax=Achromobacter sp. Marseille-Q0513 TaxID=2829161 RepID=UPI001B996225|nr:antibiotic biosynthesis monooxygenase [Achromobacter sp. Marseille-Q0513]MBR8653281.1 antibiotic biosynthesis monooxygenase [Achromobacter sp. Marseille-Q0513]